MKKLAATALGLLISLCASFADAQTPTPPLDLATADWSVKQAKILNAEPNQAVWKFINVLWSTTGPTTGPDVGKLCEFHFADLRHSGELSLVVSYDGGGTADCNYVATFEKDHTAIEEYDFDFSSGANFSFDNIEDVNGDGQDELVVDSIFASVGIDHCMATWPTIYAWNGSGYSDVSAESKGYYRKALADLKRQITAAAPTPAPEQAERPPIAMEMQTYENQSAGPSPQGVNGQFFPGRSVPDPSRSSHGNFLVEVPDASPSPAQDTSGIDDCSKALAAKFQRFLGSREAGIDDAIKWAKSDDPNDRKFAIDVLYDIGTPKADKYLRMLSTDKDPNIANSAKDVLKAGGARGMSVQPTIHGEMFYPDTSPPRTK